MRLGSWTHLLRRFLQVVSAEEMLEEERREVEAWLDRAGESAIYWTQSVADQRHGLETARKIAADQPARRDLIRAGLLHDVGKQHANLGVIGRSLASFLAKLRVPLRGSWQRYLDHGPRGADDLARVGSEPLVVDFTRHHHHDRPTTITEADWELLQDADR